MDLRQLFKGIAVVIDDQIFDNGSSCLLYTSDAADE